jgi:uncharacterized protein YggU (UPF0235/DUF167 family)
MRLIPKSSRDLIGGSRLLADGRAVLEARVRAVPEAGRANAALIRLIAGALDVAPAKVTVESGAKARVKILRIEGDAELLGRRLAALVSSRS